MRFLSIALLLGFVGMVACVSDAPDTSCEDYCVKVNKVCVGSDAQFVTATGTMDPMPSCRAICALYPKDKTSTSSLKCRVDQLTQSSEGKVPLHQVCMDAGPFSDACGGRVTNFCNIDVALCGTIAFASEAACETAMSGVTDGLDKGVNDPITMVNTKLCRFYHVEKTTESATVHCPHTKAPVSPICVN